MLSSFVSDERLYIILNSFQDVIKIPYCVLKNYILFFRSITRFVSRMSERITCSPAFFFYITVCVTQNVPSHISTIFNQQCVGFKIKSPSNVHKRVNDCLFKRSSYTLTNARRKTSVERVKRQPETKCLFWDSVNKSGHFGSRRDLGVYYTIASRNGRPSFPPANNNRF